MILHGSNLILKKGNQAIAGAVSCQLSVKGATIPVSSPTDGRWEHSIPGLNSWSVSTDHLLYGEVYNYIEGMSCAHDNVGVKQATFVRTLNDRRATEGRGLTLYGIDDTFNIIEENLVDTYEDATRCSEVIALIQGSTCSMLALVSWDAFGMTQGLLDAIAQYFHVDVNGIPLGTGRASLVAIGCKDTDAGAGIISYVAPGDAYRQQSHARLNFTAAGIPSIITPLRDSVRMIGTEFDMTVQVDGFGSDRLQGKVIVTGFDVQGPVRSLLKGSFTFLGNGPLE